MTHCALEVNGQEIYQGSRRACVRLQRLLNCLQQEDARTYEAVVRACEQAMAEEQRLGITDAEWN